MSTLTLPVKIKGFMAALQRNSFHFIDEECRPIKATVESFVQIFLPKENKEIRIGICDGRWVCCEVIDGEGEMRPLTEHEEIQYNELFGSVIYRF